MSKFLNRSRKTIPKQIEKDKYVVAEDDENNISVNRAKTACQLKRNAALKKAKEALEKKNLGQSVTVEWQMKDPSVPGRFIKDRCVKVAAAVAFLQTKADVVGTFVMPYQDVVL